MPFRFSVDGQYIDDIEKMDFDDAYGIRKIISGDFVEGGIVTVNIDGNIITRKVRWSNIEKDLVIVYKGLTYSLSEFTAYEMNRNRW